MILHFQTKRMPPNMPKIVSPKGPKSTRVRTCRKVKQPTFVTDPKHTLIGVFNHKGGVGKTTVSINLAYSLASTSNVLLIEADQQCNVRQFFEKSFTANVDENEDEDDDDEMTAASALQSLHSSDYFRPPSKSYNFPYTIRHSSHKNAQPAEVSNVDMGDNNTLYEALFKYIGFINRKTALPSHIELPKPKNGTNRVWLVPGTPDIMEIEKTLVDSKDDKSDMGNFRIAAFRMMIINLMDKLNCPVAIIDFGPHSGYLNRVLVTSCDLILPPCFPDRLSFGSSHSLLDHVLPSWFRWYDEKIKDQTTEIMKPKLPYVLPFVVTNYKLRFGSLLKAASTWAESLATYTSKDALVESHRIKINGDRSLITLCPQEEAMMEQAYKKGCALVEMDKVDNSSMVATFENIKLQYQELAHFITQLTQHIS